MQLDVLAVRAQIKTRIFWFEQVRPRWDRLTKGERLFGKKSSTPEPSRGQREAHAKAHSAEKAARHEIKNDRNSGKKPTNDALQRRGEALTTMRDVNRDTNKTPHKR